MGLVGAALIGVGAIVAGQYGMETVEPPPPAILADSKEIVDKALPTNELGLETPATRFDRLATVTDPDGYSNVRDTPSNGGLIVGRVQVGKAFATCEQTGKWWHVRLPDGTTGYIARSRIQLSDEAEASSKSGREAEAPGYATISGNSRGTSRATTRYRSTVLSSRTSPH